MAIKILGPEHSQVAFKLYNLANLREERGHLEEAIEHYRRASDPTSYHTSLTVYALANLHAERNQYADADSLYRQAVAQWDASGHADTVARAEMVRARAALLRRQGREAEARSVEGGD